MVTVEKDQSTISLVQLLHSLVHVDTKIANLEEQLTKNNTTLNENKHLALKLTQNLDALEKKTLAARKKVMTDEAEVKNMRAKEDEKRTLLQTITTDKEYKAASREVELLKKQNMTAENTLIEDWQIAEALEQQLKIEQPISQKKLDELIQSNAECTKVLAELTEEHKKLLEEKHQRLALIPSEWLTRYHKMQALVPNPIVATASGCCGGCFYTIVAQEYTRIKKGELLLCRNCYRFLYFDTEKETTTTQP